MTEFEPTYLADNLGELWLLVPGFADLLLTGDNTDDSGNAFRIMAQASEATWGNPVPIDVEVQRWMTDGAVASTQGHGNREPSFQVIVSAGTATDLAAGEAALALRGTQQCLLKWVPPSGPADAPATIFEVWTWHLEHAFDLDRELRLARSYTVQMTAKPWVRSEYETVADPVPSVSAVAAVPIDTCTSTTNWTGSPNTVTTSGGAVRETYTVTAADVSAGRGVFGMALTRNASVTGLGSTPYLVLDMKATGGAATLQVSLDGVPLLQVAALGTSSWWALPAGVTSFTELEVDALVTRSVTGTITLIVSDVSASDTPGGVGSHKQLFRTLVPGGSIKTSGSIGVTAPSGNLGTVLVYTAPQVAGFVPAMRGYRITGYDETVASDSTCVSGARERIDATGAAGATFTASVPADQMQEATYAVVARMKCANAETQTILTSAFLSGRLQYGALSTDVVFAAADTFQWCVLGLIALPPSPIPAESTQPTKINIAKSLFTAAHQVWVDELYLFDVTNGALSMIVPDTADGHPNLWLDAADADPARNRPAVYVGNSADRSDAMGVGYWQIQALGDHDLYPQGTLLFTVTDGINDATVTASYFQRWHTQAGA